MESVRKNARRPAVMAQVLTGRRSPPCHAEWVIWVVVRRRVGERGDWGSLGGRVRVVVFVVAAYPHLGRVPLMAAEGGAVEEAVVSDHEFDPAGGRGVGQVDGWVLERVGAHRRRLGQVCRGLGPAVLGEPGGYRGNAAGQELARGLRRAGDLEVEVVVAAVGGGPREAPPHPPLVRLELLQGRPRDAGKRHIPRVQMRYRTVEAVRPRRAGRAARRVVRAEHEVIDDQLRAPVKELSQRLWPLGGVEPVFLLDRHPGQRAPRGGQLVAAARQLFFLREQFVAGRLPLLAGCDFAVGHRCPSFLTGRDCLWMSRVWRPGGSLRLRPVDRADTGRLRKWAVVSARVAGQDPERPLALAAAGRVMPLSRAGSGGGRTGAGCRVRSG